MNKKLIAGAMGLLVVLGALCAGCSKPQDTTKEWTPAKAGMSHDQFVQMFNEKMKERQAAVGSTAAGPVPPAGLPAKTQ